jgi:dihydroflavonol-4-reductase
MRKVLITGATGFLGTHLVNLLLEKPLEEVPECSVRLLCRKDNPWEGNARVETAQGDVLDRASVGAAVRGVESIIHLAGLVARDPRTSSRMLETHIEGTRNVCEAAVAEGKPKLIIASSSGTIAASREPLTHTEDSPYAIDVAGHWPYYLSKIYQEKTAISYYRKESLPVVTLNPSLLLGPGDTRSSSTNDVRMFLNRQITNIPGGGLNFVDVRDAAACFVSAIENGRAGRRYLIGGHNMTIREFFFLIQWVSGVRAPLLSLPESWSRRGANVLRRGMELIGRTFPLDDRTIEMAYRFWYLDNTRARKELGLDPRPADQTVRDTVGFLQRNKPQVLAS